MKKTMITVTAILVVIAIWVVVAKSISARDKRVGVAPAAPAPAAAATSFVPTKGIFQDVTVTDLTGITASAQDVTATGTSEPEPTVIATAWPVKRIKN